MTGIWRLAPASAAEAPARVTWLRQDHAIAVRLPRVEALQSLRGRIDAALGLAAPTGLLTFGTTVAAHLAERRLVDIDVFVPQIDTVSLDALPLAGPIVEVFYEGKLDENDRAGFEATIRIEHDPARRIILIRMDTLAVSSSDLVCLAPGCQVALGDATLPIRAVLLAAPPG